MKHKIFLCALALSALLLAGCAQEQSQLSYIGAETAKGLALEAAGLSASGVEFTATDMSSRNGMDYYLVGFTAEGVAYSYAIDALTGTVLEAQTDPPSEAGAVDPLTADQAASQAGAVTQPASSGQSIPAAPSSSTAAAGAGSASAAPSNSAAAAGANGDAMISLEDAKATALSHAGFTSDQVTFVESKLDYDDGLQVYEVEFYTQDYQEYDYEIDAYTGEIVSYDYDAEYYTPPASGSGAAITAEEAKALALAQVPGAASSDIIEFETDYDDGRLEYEGKILYNGMEYEFEIDAYSCAFRGGEAECVNHSAHHGIHH